MNNKIIVLPELIANKIAAGEVVQRPESVVKELIENSIDAGATKIELIIKNAGKSLIQVIDNGSGMSPEDAITSVKRHATSKLRTIEDLEQINTLGFRGEALNSISSVSRFELKTQQIDENFGVMIRNDDKGQFTSEEITGHTGTSISIKNLFYNIPARRHFLKTNSTELKYIIESFKKYALSNTDIEFVLYNDGYLMYNLKKGNIEERMKMFFADNILDALIEVNEPTELLSIKGYISKPTYLKKNRAEQYLFVNNRPVFNKTINHSVFSAYDGLLQKGEYPFFLLFFEMDPKHFDINVHPAKLEIKFDEDNWIHSIVSAVMRKNINILNPIPESELNRQYSYTYDKPFERDITPDNKNAIHMNLDKNNEIEVLFESLEKELVKQKNNSINSPFDNEYRTIYHQNTESTTSVSTSFVVVLHNKFILAQIKSGVMVIDIHTAHKRILYENALKSFNANIPFSQQLLFPESILLDTGDYLLLKELNEYFEKIGFELKFIAKNTLLITGVPLDVKQGSEKEILLGILYEIKNNNRIGITDIKDNIAKAYSRKTARKPGDKLDEKEARYLVDQLFATSMPYKCPDGHPVILKISIDELDKKFSGE